MIGITLLIRIVLQVDMFAFLSAVVEGTLRVSNKTFKTFIFIRCIHPKAHLTGSQYCLAVYVACITKHLKPAITDTFISEIAFLKSYWTILKCNVENSCRRAARDSSRVEQKLTSGVRRCDGVTSVCAQPFFFL